MARDDTSALEKHFDCMEEIGKIGCRRFPKIPKVYFPITVE